MNIKVDAYKPQFTISATKDKDIVATMSLRDKYGMMVEVTLTKCDLTVLQNLICSVNEGMIDGATYNLGSDDLMIDMPEDLKEQVMRFMLKDKVEEVEE